MRKSILVTSMCVVLLSGCAGQATNTQKGAGIGAVLGALIGKGTGDNDKSRYVWGAVVGAIAGSAIGSYMDKQEQEFRDQLSDTGVEVKREGDSLRLIMPSNITFATGSASIDNSFYPVIEDVALVINRYEKTVLQVEGHTDDVGSPDFNQQLSESRASSVKRILLANKVDDRRVTTIGFGEYQPVVDNTTTANRQLNRRVELRIMPLTN